MAPILDKAQLPISQIITIKNLKTNLIRRGE